VLPSGKHTKKTWTKHHFFMAKSYTTMENHNFSWVNPRFLWPCSASFLALATLAKRDKPPDLEIGEVVPGSSSGGASWDGMRWSEDRLW
jgi:hypothetical protein